MDVTCATCQEPWDHYHMLHDEPQEIWDGIKNSSSHLLIKKFAEGDKTSIPMLLRKDLAEKGWKFGKTIVCILECACCYGEYPTEDASDVENRKQLRLEAEEMLGGDLDGLISTLTSVDNFTR